MFILELIGGIVNYCLNKVIFLLVSVLVLLAIMGGRVVGLYSYKIGLVGNI